MDTTETTSALSRPNVRILAWPRRSPSNAYTGSLNDHVAAIDGVELTGLDMRPAMLLRAIVRRYDIFHIHWLERAFWAETDLRAVRQALHILAIATLLRLRGTKFVWTAHDPQPHDAKLNSRLRSGVAGRLWQPYRRYMQSLIDGVLLLSESHRAIIAASYPALRAKPMGTVPHPHYRGAYPDTVGREGARRALGLSPDTTVFAFVGSLRRYKHPEAALEAFADFDGDAALLMVGAAEDAAHAEALRSLAARDRRIRLELGFVADEALQNWLRAADVAVLPYRRVTNSGSAHLALSFDVPVLVPDEPVFHELQAIVGPRWVRCYQGTLDGAALAGAAMWGARPRAASPDLTRLDWHTIANDTLQFFEKVKAGSML